MDSSRDASGRRRFLAGAAGTLAAVAGCVDGREGGDDDGGGDPGRDRNGTDDGEDTATDGGAERGVDTDGLDRREANVVDVAINGGGGTYALDVSLYHDDDGEDGYADWWQVERLDGTRLGRRELRHAHSRQPFTRSETIEIPAGVDCVVVRGHDRTHGYGGVAAVLDVDSGAYRTVEQGSERRPFDAGDCP